MNRNMDVYNKTFETKFYKDVVKKFYENFIPDKYDEMPVIPEIRSLWKFEDEVIDKYVEDGSYVLDVGCGTGRHLLFLKRKSCKVVGLDYSREMIEIAKRKVRNVDIILADMRDMPFSDNFFDYSICMFSTLGNVEPGRERAFHEMYRVSRKAVIFSVYKSDALNTIKAWYEQYIGLHVDKIRDNTIYLKEGLISHFFSKKELEELISREHPKRVKIFDAGISWVVVVWKR